LLSPLPLLPLLLILEDRREPLPLPLLLEEELIVKAKSTVCQKSEFRYSQSIASVAMPSPSIGSATSKSQAFANTLAA
jgi:hypothetical protein